MYPDISIIVPHLNQPGRLAKLLASLQDQSIDGGRLEIIVVDNGSRAMPTEVVGGFPGVRLAREPAPGPGPARNLGVSLSRAPILAFVDADCLADRAWAETILARFAADPSLEIIGGDVRVTVETPGQPNPAEAYDLLYAFPQKRYIERMSFSGAGNLATRREVFAAVGPFAGIEVAEDTDWGHRAARLGYRTIYVPEMVVYHPARRSMDELYRKWDRNISHHYAAFGAGPGGKLRWIAKAVALPVAPLAEVPRIVGSDRISGAGTRWLTFRSLFALHVYRARKMVAVLGQGETRAASAKWNRT